ncbi:MAG: DUF5694 domain-containing protein [Candidatus Poribacteria bacterium]|nr:DUF5694 domain-containing protein [Candidatus Poribacteria bacterium]
MKVLVKCEFCFMTLLATMLLLSGIATGNDQPESKAETQQIPQKPTIMILGSAHLSNNTLDAFNIKMDDVRAPKRQREIKQLVEQLKAFKPTKIALEVDEIYDAEVEINYQEYLKGTYKLNRSEHDQIGFQLAKQMGHPKLYCVDYRVDARKNDPFIPWGEGEFDVALLDYRGFAKAHNQEHLLPTPSMPEGKATQDEKGQTWIELDAYISIIDLYIQWNQPEGIRKDHQHYMRWVARIGLDDQYPGANWLSHFWYDRNIKIYVNLTRITESVDDRILLIIGGAHVYLIQQFFEESGDYIIESPLKYLDADDADNSVSEEAD